jgi:transposase
MQVQYERCAGLHVHKKTVVACVLAPDGQGGWCRQIRTFGTMTADLLALADWLQSWGCTHVARESTREYWKPVFNLLEGTGEVVWVNAQHVKAVPGRETDVKDAEWLAELLQHGLLRPSFIPPVAQRELRDLTRSRSTFIRERATLVNRVHKVLEDANLKLAAVASNIMSVSGRAMLAALSGGQVEPGVLADLAKGRLRDKREQLVKALEGRVKPHHRFVWTELLCQIDSLDEAIARFDNQLQAVCGPFEDAVALLDTTPGVAPGNHESAGKHYAGTPHKGNRTLRTLLTQVAHAAARTKDTYLAAQYRRLAARRGQKKAMIAVAHSLLVMAYYILLRKEPYREAGADYFDRCRPEATAKRLLTRLQQLGYHVAIEPRPTEAVV